MLYCTVHALGEMAVLFPVSGSFSAYSTRFLDPASSSIDITGKALTNCVTCRLGDLLWDGYEKP